MTRGEFQDTCKGIWAELTAEPQADRDLILATVDEINRLAGEHQYPQRFQAIGPFAFMVDPGGSWSFSL